MKNIFIIVLLLSYTLHAIEKLSCQKHLEKLDSNDTIFNGVDGITLSAIDEIDLSHSFSSASISLSHGLNFLDFSNLKECSSEERKKLRHYWSLVSLFAINDGEILIDDETIAQERNELKKIEELLDEKFYYPTKNNERTKENLKAILQFYGRDISTVNIKQLAQLIKNFKDSPEYIGTTLLQLSNNFGNKISNLAISKENYTVDYLISIVKSKNLYKHPSWLAMNFYNKELEQYNVNNGSFKSSIESELLTTDMNNSISFQYFMSKKGKINDKNSSQKYHYFLAEDGTINPLHEMEATLHYFFDKQDNLHNERSCSDYFNRYVLLKQMFKKINTFPNINCSSKKNKDQFEYGYFTTGKKSDESFGHSILHVISTTQKKKETMSKTKTSFSSNLPHQLVQYVNSNTSNESSDDYYINFALNTPLKMNFLEKLKYDINGIIGNSNGVFTKLQQLAIGDNYQGRMLVLFPIKSLAEDEEKRELFSAQINHIIKNHDKLEIPYYFASKNCAYVIENLLEVPFPDLRKKFNNEGYVSFTPKDVIKLLKGKIDVSKHKANHI